MNNNTPEYLSEYLPEYISILREPDYIMIRRRWFAGRYVIALVFIILIPGFFVFNILQEEGFEFDLWTYFVSAVIVPWYLYVVYYIVTKLLNSTYVYVNPQHITITHRPLPYAKSLKINTSNIAEVFQEQKRYKGRARRKYYQVNAITPEKRKVTLVSDIDIEAQADMIKNEIARFLELRRS
jgi:hypothetical protein